MPAPPPALLPLLRSRNQLRLLTALMLEPGRSYTLTELATETGVPQPSVSREVRNLVDAGVVVTQTVHGQRLVQADTSSIIFPELSSLVLKTAGPKVVLERVLTGLAGIDRALIYGSWARRYAGEPGMQPQDIDLLVVGSPDVSEVRLRADAASEELGRDVNTTVLSPEEWQAKSSGFLRQLHESPRVPLDLHERA